MRAIISSAWARSSGERSSRFGPPSISDALVAGRSSAPDRSTGTSPSGVHRLIGGSLSSGSKAPARVRSGPYCAGVGLTRYRRRLTTERKRDLGPHPATSEQFHRPDSCARVAAFSFLKDSLVRSHDGSDRFLRRISEFRWVSAFVRRLPFFIFGPVPKPRNTRRHVPITMRREDLARMRSDRP